MIADLEPYPAMKDSGVPWLGEVPGHWEVIPLKRVTLSRCDGPFGSGLKSSHYTDAGVRVVRLQNIGHAHFRRADAAFISPAYCASLGDHSVLADDLLIAGLGDDRHPTGRACVTPNDIEPAMVKADCFRFRLIRSRIVTQFAALHLSATAEAASAVLSTGATRQRTNLEATSSRAIALPPIVEQAAIVRFLDHADRRIRRYIRAKQKLVKLLEEQKQAIIHRAVTRGLDPNVRLRPSGVEWLGEVPGHWGIVRLKEVTTPIEQGWSPQCDAQPASDGEWGVLKVGCVNRDAFEVSENKKLPAGSMPIPDLEVRDGDILVSRANTRELLGLAAVALRPRQKLLLCDKLFRFRALPHKSEPRFLVLAIRGKTSRAQIESSTHGASDSMQNIGQAVVRNLRLSLPPIDEQRRLIAAIDGETVLLRATSDRAQREIVLLREYRTRLIADVVTGKLHVRAAAASLPDEADEPAALYDSETSSDGDDDTAADDLDAAPEEADA